MLDVYEGAQRVLVRHQERLYRKVVMFCKARTAGAIFRGDPLAVRGPCGSVRICVDYYGARFDHVLGRLAELSPDHAQTVAGRVAMYRGDLDHARDILAQAVLAVKSAPTTLQSLATSILLACYCCEGAILQGREVGPPAIWPQLLRIRPLSRLSRHVNTVSAEAAQSCGDWEGALAIYRRLTEATADPDRLGPAYCAMAGCHVALGDPGERDRYLDLALLTNRSTRMPLIRLRMAAALTALLQRMATQAHGWNRLVGFTYENSSVLVS